MTYLFSARGSLENCQVWGRVGQPFFLGPGRCRAWLPFLAIVTYVSKLEKVCKLHITYL